MSGEADRLLRARVERNIHLQCPLEESVISQGEYFKAGRKMITSQTLVRQPAQQQERILLSPQAVQNDPDAGYHRNPHGQGTVLSDKHPHAKRLFCNGRANQRDTGGLPPALRVEKEDCDGPSSRIFKKRKTKRLGTWMIRLQERNYLRTHEKILFPFCPSASSISRQRLLG